MAMHDWNNYRSQIVAGVGEIGKLSPDTVKGYMTLGSAGAKTGHLEAKKLGVTEGELAEALGVAVSINAGAALVYSTRTHDAFKVA